MIDPRTHKVFQVIAPLRTHFRAAKTCAEVDCANYLNGWKTVVDETTDLGQRQARYIRRDSGRGFTEQKNGTGLTEFLFEPGQNCFRLADHRVSLDKPQRYIERNRGGPVEVSYDHWQEDFYVHQERIKRERG